MAIPTTIESLSTTAASNGPSGSDDRSTADDGLRYAYAFIRQTVSLGSNIASASTITPPSTGYAFNITGVTTITTIASTNSWDGRLILLIFAGSLTLTHSSNLALPGSANITTAANDIAEFVQTASGAWRLVNYRTATGATVIVTSSGSALTLTGASGATRCSLLNGSYHEYQLAGVTFGYIGDRTGVLGSGSGMTFRSDGAMYFASGGSSERVVIGGSGNVTINAPGSGTALTVNPISGGGNFIIGTDGTATMQLATLGATGGLLGMSSNHKLELVTNGQARIQVAAAGNVTINAPSSGYGLNIPTGTPASAVASGTAGDIAWDSSYIYVCTAANTWKRAALSTW